MKERRRESCTDPWGNPHLVDVTWMKKQHMKLGGNVHTDKSQEKEVPQKTGRREYLRESDSLCQMLWRCQEG